MIRKASSLTKIATIDIGRVLRDLFLNVVPSSRLVPTFARFALYRLCGIDCQRSRIYPGVYFGSTKVSIGKNAMINRGCFLEGTGPIHLGENVHLGMHVILCTSTHEVGSSFQRAGRTIWRPIAIGDGCWLGAGTIVLPGVSIGAGTVVAAGSVVTQDCESESLYAGVPAVRKKSLEVAPRQSS